MKRRHNNNNVKKAIIKHTKILEICNITKKKNNEK
jgi:hypothetical protein